MKGIHQRYQDSTFPFPDCSLSPLIPSQRSKALCAWLPSPHYLQPALICCWLGLLFVLPFFAFYSQSQVSILLQMCRIKNHIANSFLLCCLFFKSFFIYIDSFSYLTHTHTNLLSEVCTLWSFTRLKKMPLGTAGSYLRAHTYLTFTSSHLHSIIHI